MSVGLVGGGGSRVETTLKVSGEGREGASVRLGLVVGVKIRERLIRIVAQVVHPGPGLASATVFSSEFLTEEREDGIPPRRAWDGLPKKNSTPRKCVRSTMTRQESTSRCTICLPVSVLRKGPRINNSTLFHGGKRNVHYGTAAL